MSDRMQEISSNQKFVSLIVSKDIQSYSIRVPEAPMPRAPIRSLSFDCPCGQTHAFQQKNDLFNPKDYDFFKAVNGQHYPSVAAWIGEETCLVKCPQLNGLVHLYIKKGIFKQNVRVSGYIRYETLNSAEHGFGLRIKTNIGTLDFNTIGQSRSNYPTKELTTLKEFEDELLNYPEEVVYNLNCYATELKDSSYKCPCGDTHFMGGTRADFSKIQFNGLTPQPVFAVYQDISRKTLEGLIYRCSERYTMLSARPSMPALWSAKIDLIGRDQKETKLNARLFSHLSALTNSIQVDQHFQHG